MGFETKWVQLIMACVRSAHYLVLVNGNPVGDIRRSRRIRQGDPISPYLFLICVEVPSSLLTQAKQKRIITGVPTSPKGSKISHIFFADDNILFCKPNSVEWWRLLKKQLFSLVEPKA